MGHMSIRSTMGVLLAVASLMGCGGEAVVDGGGGAGGTTTTPTGPTTTTTGPTQTCTSHSDCHGDVCLFGTGQCAPACTPNACDSCGAGSFCEPCASSSCPDCDDCVAACVPASSGRCDEDDPCPAGQLCEWWTGTCLPSCDDDVDCGGFAYCDPCATSSCCACKDCAPACLGGE